MNNPLIDDYGQNNPEVPGEDGKEVVLGTQSPLKAKEKELLDKHKINVVVSDIVPLHRR